MTTLLPEITDVGRASHRKAAGIIEQVDESLTVGVGPAERAAATTDALRVIASVAGPPGVDRPG